MERNNFDILYKEIQDNIKKYLIDNNIKAICTGISGGIDSTVNVALLRPICNYLNIPIIGRYIHIESNKSEERVSADLVGNAFCDDYKSVDLTELYKTSLSYFEESLEDNSLSSKIRRGNIKARLRMMYIRGLAHKNKGIMLDNTNKTEWNLGYFTIADNGDISPLFDLWKTEVFKLADWIMEYYQKLSAKTDDYDEVVNSTTKNSYFHKFQAIQHSIKLKPTAGLGITNNDLEEIGAESYEQVDNILQEILAWKWLSLEKRGDKYDSVKEMRDAFLEEQAMYCYPIEVIIAITDRHFNSEFKRKQLPIKITRDEI